MANNARLAKKNYHWSLCIIIKKKKFFISQVSSWDRIGHSFVIFRVLSAIYEFVVWQKMTNYYAPISIGWGIMHFLMATLSVHGRNPRGGQGGTIPRKILGGGTT